VETWRLITTWNASAAFNMGLDEALLESQGAPTTLRFYTWKPATLSLGYFQRFAEVPEVREARSIVRRITGGGAIHHQAELTFSIAADLSHPLYEGSVARSYERVHRAIAGALSDLGVTPELRGERPLASERPGSAMCFHGSTAIDLVWNDRKGVGSAQRRKGARVLHHGSIKIGTTPLEGDIATLTQARPGLSPELLAPILRAGLERELGIRLEAGVPDPEERRRAAELGKRFVDPAFVRRR
jgi:lipoyl(octanoyl) transferase